MHERIIYTSMRKNGLFVTFEGSEGCGKSTQIGLLAKELILKGRDPLLLREPGGTSAGEVIRNLLQHAPEGSRVVPEAELLLFAASRAQLVAEVILPALAADRTIICDRFLDSTTVYQGVARKIPEVATAQINTFAVGGCLPDITFLLDLDRNVARTRLVHRGLTTDRIEGESEPFFEDVRRGYLELAAREPERIKVINAAGTPEQIASVILDHLERFK